MFETLRFKGNGPHLTTIIRVGAVLERAAPEGPLGLDDICRRLRPSRPSKSSVRTCVNLWKDVGFVIEGSKGIQWTKRSKPLCPSPADGAKVFGILRGRVKYEPFDRHKEGLWPDD